MIKRIKIFIMSLSLVLLIAGPVLAASTDILVETQTGKYYQYDMLELVKSYNSTNQALFSDFQKKLEIGQVKAYYDNKIEYYVDFAKIVGAYNENTDQFDLHKFTENAKYDDIIPVNDEIQTIVEENGEVKEGQIIKKEEYFDVYDIF